MTRRRAACLLEDGKPDEAIDAFEALYRAERGWSRLSDWLVRAHAAARRSARAGEGDNDDGDDDDGGGSRRRRSSEERGGGRAADGDAGGAEAEVLARESDHYVVLGVTVDATDKQLQQARAHRPSRRRLLLSNF